MLLTQASSQYQKKQLWFTCCLESQRQILDGSTALVLRTAILLAVNAVLLSLGFQYIHVSGKLRFSSKTQTAMAISCPRRFCYTTSCLITWTLLTIDAGRIPYSPRSKLYQLGDAAVQKPLLQECLQAKHQSWEEAFSAEPDLSCWNVSFNTARE